MNWFNPFTVAWWTRRTDWRDELAAAVVIGCEAVWMAWMATR